MNNLRLAIFVLLIHMNCTKSASVQRCDPVPKYLRDLYQRLTIARNNSGMNKATKLTTSATQWRTSSLRVYFNLSSLSTWTKILKADLIFYRGLPSVQQTLIYTKSYGLVLKDINSSSVIYNRTLASNDRFCLVKNVLNLIQRWRSVPESNQGLLLTVKDTGRYSTTLETFYPKHNIAVPTLALFVKPAKIFVKTYKLIPSNDIQIVNSND